ncbi:MAG: CBS domain-containing protein [Negativicutes bacterium]|nr:CBS domain-containing protein [Negativicutes bacterium]
MFVVNRMTPNPVTVNSTTTVADASEIMRRNKFRRLPVINIGSLVGIVTDRDLQEVSPSRATTLSIFELNYLLSKVQVKEVMTKNVITIRDNATIEEAALLMYSNKIGGLVVVDEKDSVVGIITETDIFKSFVDIMGLTSGKTRITIKLHENKVGMLNKITGIMTDMGININSMASYSIDQEWELVIRADITDITALSEKLASIGYPITHVAQIGN